LDETGEQGMRLGWFRLELRVILDGYKPRMVWKFNHFYQ
jgi:hypothetical protein